MKKKQLDKAISQEVAGDLEKFEYFFGTYWKQAIFIAGVVVVLVALAFGLWKYRQSNIKEANIMLAAARSEAELNAALDKHPAEAAACFARLRLARLYMDQGKFAPAAAQFKQIADDKQLPTDFRYRSKLDYAYLLEQLDRYPEALQTFIEVGSKGKASASIRAEANYSAGRLLIREKNFAKAKEYLRQAQTGDSAEGAFAVGWAKMASLLENSLD